jgi:shikimate dehydrogenase
MKTLRLGLIGNNITQSRSPALQIACGLSVGRNASYDLLIPHEQGLSFEALLLRCQTLGFDGVNVTYPFKEEVLRHVSAGTAEVKRLGAANTVTFGPQGARAFNTDHTGFVAAYKARFSTRSPGRVLILGAGGVGRAIAFALANLGAEEIVLGDIDSSKSLALRDDLAQHDKVRVINLAGKAPPDLAGADGVINATPLGMTGRKGCVLPDKIDARPRWGFDAVYTPEHTEFSHKLAARGADMLPGYELYFHQGIQGFQLFAGVEISDPEWVRRVLAGMK